MTEHRCIDGTWQPGKIRDCEACAVRTPPPKAKRTPET